MLKEALSISKAGSVVICLAICFQALAQADDIDYGAGKVNSLAANKNAQMGGRDDYPYLALENHQGPSGVPVGGIGVGCFDYAPNGAFTRISINNWHTQGGDNFCVENVPASFLAIWDGDQSTVLRRDNGNTETFAGMKLAQKTVYRGLFPIAECTFDDKEKVRVWSGLVPHDVKDSSLPLAWVEVDLTNPSNVAKPMAVAFSWQDVIGREIRDIQDKDVIAKMDGKSVWDRDKILDDANKAGKTTWIMLPRVATTASELTTGGFTGVRQHSEPLVSNLKTYQNYNNEIAVLAQEETGAETTLLPAYEVDAPDAAWEGFRKEGRFSVAEHEQPLFDPANPKEKASAVAVRVNLRPGEKRTIRFLVAWFQPEMDLTQSVPGGYFGKADYGRYYMNYFGGLTSLVGYAGRERARIESETRSWQQPILDSTYPDWLKFKVINSAYTLYTNTILNKEGDFTVMEGAMDGLAGTMDQRISAHPFYFKFFTQLDRSDLELFGNHPGSGGQILHFDGHYYFGLDSPDGTTPVPENWMVDNSGGWLLQVAKDYQQSGDLKWLEQFRERIPHVLDFLRAHIESKAFYIPMGPTTYDDFSHPDIYAYTATTWPAFLRAGAVLERALGDNEKAEECEKESQTASRDALRALWNGKYFAYGAELDGSQRRDDIMFSGQLAGEFMSRCFGLGDVFPMDVVRASVVAQLKTNVSHSPDYYAPKVWLIKEGKAMNDPHMQADNGDSTCWPFYLESYTAMTAIQAGYVNDGLDIMRHIQLLNLRNGWTWSQELWRPGELPYVTAPVSWFITDVLAGAGLDVPSGTLRLAPLLLPQEDYSVLPVYFPSFWGVIRTNRANKSITFQVTRVFGTPRIIIKQVVAQPVGISTADERKFDIPPFLIKEGAQLDLSPVWDHMMDSVQQNAVLPQADAVPYIDVPLSSLVH